MCQLLLSKIERLRSTTTATAPLVPSTTGPTVHPYYNVSQGSCLPGWYYLDKFCFWLVPYLGNKKSKELTARKKCLESGADLAMPRTQSILKRLWSVYDGRSWNIPEARLGPLFLGAPDSLNVDWKWSDGSKVNSSVWGPEEPTYNGKCGVMANLKKNFFSSRAWSTVCGWWLTATFDCDRKRGFICETLPVNETCKAGFVLIDGRCYKIYDQARLNLKDARLNCSHDHGGLSKVNTTAQREGLSAILETLNLDIAKDRLYVDPSLDLNSWMWIDGSPIDSTLWKSGYPRENDVKTCVVLDRYTPAIKAIKNVPCVSSGVIGFICQSREVNAGFRAVTIASSVAQPYDCTFAVDNNLTTCFRSKQCVKDSSRCDGKPDCLDNSDEINCTCLQNQFQCPSGKCLAAEKLCDGYKDCPDGSDEKRHCTPKPYEFQCVNGSFVPWSKTCKDSIDSCQDDTHKPSICDSKQCPLNTLTCLNDTSKQPSCNPSSKSEAFC
ncbi:hypothetical protein ACROYT_G001594 [Oculina patagonica]